MKSNLTAGRMLIVLSTMTILSGCTAAGSVNLQPVNLPPASACMAPVPVPGLKAGDDARLALARSRAALGQANGRLVCSRKWYDGVRKSFAPSQ